MFTQRKLKKMGFKKGEVDTMEIKDIIELGKLGYTKDEINQLKAEEKPAINKDVDARIKEIESKIDKMVADAQNEAVHKTAVNTDPGAPVTDEVNDILSKLAGGEDGR